MATLIRTCRVCSTSTRHEEDYLVMEDSDDPDVPGTIGLKATGPGDGVEAHLAVVCGDCALELERKFAHPIWAIGRTLGDVMIEAHNSLLAIFPEADYQREIREVFPNLSDSLARPALDRARWWEEQLGKILAHIGAPLCIFRPDWAEDELEDQVFLMAGLIDTKPGSGCCYVADWDGVLDEREALNAHEYAPDGTPMRPNRG